MSTKILTIIYAPKTDNLIQFKNKASHWLPETNSLTSTSKVFLNIYEPPNIICTTKATSLDLIKTLITSYQLNHSKVIWINASDLDDVIAYSFNQLGEINNFFKI